MSRELSVNFNGAAASLYAIVRRRSDAYVWNGSAFAAWSDGSIGTYDLPLTDRGGDLYDADFPSAIAAGDYEIVYYVQAGGSPAITDETLTSELRHWNGQALGTASDVTLSAYALTTLESVKRRLAITDSDSDTLLTEFINQVSMAIERVCGRRFAARDYREWYDGTGQRRLTLRHFPVIDLTRVAYGRAPAMTLAYAGTGIRATANVYHDSTGTGGTNAGLRLVSVNASGVRTTNNLSFASYPSISLLATAVNLLTGWTATVVTNVPSADLGPLAGMDAVSGSGGTLTLNYPDQAWLEVTADYETGKLQYFGRPPFVDATRYVQTDRDADVGRPTPRGHQNILVEYRGGFETIPDDVVGVCNRLVQDAYFEAQVGRGVTETKLGPYTVKIDKGTEDTIRQDLAHYIDFGVGRGA